MFLDEKVYLLSKKNVGKKEVTDLWPNLWSNIWWDTFKGELFCLDIPEKLEQLSLRQYLRVLWQYVEEVKMLFGRNVKWWKEKAGIESALLTVLWKSWGKLTIRTRESFKSCSRFPTPDCDILFVTLIKSCLGFATFLS